MSKITLFGQIIQRLDRSIFNKLVKKHQTDKHQKGFNSWSHLISLLFSQFAKSQSLRDIISNGLCSATGNLNHLGLVQAPTKSNLSYQNKHRNWELFKDYYYKLQERLGQQAGFKQVKFKIKSKIFLLDSSTISLCLSLFDWAKYKAKKGDSSGDLGANEARLEYHLKSEFGRWDGMQWIMDNTTSPCIDAGNPADDYSNEPTPNGSRINLGAFGNTAFTSKSASELTIVDNENMDNNIYPIPTFDRLTMSDDCINKYYAIYTIAGKLVKYDKLHSNSISIKELNSGIYTLKIMGTISNKTKVFKIVKK